MKNLYALLFLSIVLTGCAEWVTQADCRELTEAQCDQENYERQVNWEMRRRRMGRAIGNSMENFGNTMRGQQTTCTNLGGFLNCTTR